ncbi:CGNR zinc finger domain-containing protein [Streptomyces sp. NPDC015232]|uniref:CGNR zinc finger domain-containing protein n=1 Tax=unclassified Streptomyces TaxID=2593676 RepID=UPI0036F634D9
MTGTVQPHSFQPRDLVGGHVVVDLVNTVTARDADPVDWLDGYPRLLEWAALTGHFTPAALADLRRLAEADPAGAARALDDVRALREAVHDVLTALVVDQADHADQTDHADHADTVDDHAGASAASPQALATLERHWKQAVARSRLTLRPDTPRVGVDTAPPGLAHLHDELALQALDLLRTLPTERTRVCPGRRCGWLFVDTSRAGRRRWCSMATCGNSAKGRTHYERRRADGR